MNTVNLSDENLCLLGFTENDQIHLISMNDEGKSFLEISRWIRDNILPRYV